jgi:hypothetical protein
MRGVTAITDVQNEKGLRGPAHSTSTPTRSGHVWVLACVMICTQLRRRRPRLHELPRQAHLLTFCQGVVSEVWFHIQLNHSLNKIHVEIIEFHVTYSCLSIYDNKSQVIHFSCRVPCIGVAIVQNKVVVVVHIPPHQRHR